MRRNVATGHRTRGTAPDPLLAAIARQGERRHVLRALEARRSMSDLAPATVIREEQATHLPLREQAEAFVEAWDDWLGRVLEADDREAWREFVEDRYGHRADAVIEAATGVAGGA